MLIIKLVFLFVGFYLIQNIEGVLKKPLVYTQTNRDEDFLQ